MMDLNLIIEGVIGLSNPHVSQSERGRYLELTQNYKEKAFRLDHLFTLLQHSDNVLVPLFGLQCCEFCITNQWMNLNSEEKAVFRDGMLKLLSNFVAPSSSNQEARLLYSQMGRVFVEMIKREWPQNWPTLVTDLIRSAGNSLGEKSVVLGVLLRLCEDLIHLGGEGLPSKRKSDIMGALQSNMDDIFNLLVQTVIHYAETFAGSGFANGHGPGPGLTICEEALDALMAYSDWVGLQYACQREGVFLEVLSRFLPLPAIRTRAVEVLLVLMRRKAKPEEKMQLRVAWENPLVFDRLETAVNELDLGRPDDVASYTFAHRLAQLMAALGSVALQLREQCYQGGLPPNYERLMKIILRLTAHPAKAISYETFSFWQSFLRELPSAPNFRVLFSSCLRLFLACLQSALLKTGLPSEDTVEGRFSRNEFAFDDDFLFFFGRHRCNVVACVRLVSELHPDEAFCFFLEWTHAMMATPVGQEELDVSGNCSSRSRSALQWDALVLFGDGVLTSLQAASQRTKEEAAKEEGSRSGLPIAQRYPDGVRLLSVLLESSTRDPLILTSQISLLTDLLPFAEGQPALITAVLQKLLSLLSYELPGQNKVSRVKSVRNLRRHASACMIRVARDQPHLLLPVFDALYEQVRTLCSSDDISVVEKCNVTEAMILLSQHLNDNAKRSHIISSILEPMRAFWCSSDMSLLLDDLRAFMDFIGLTQPISEHETCGPNRAKIMNCIMIFFSVLKRVSASQNDAFLNEVMMPILPNVFRFLKTLNGLVTPEGAALRHPDYADAFDLTEHFKFALLGIPHPSSSQANYNSPDMKKPAERMNNFLSTLYEYTLFVLGLAVQSLPDSLFVPLLFDTVSTFVLSHFEYIPDIKLCQILRLFFKPTFQACPREAYENVLVPLTSLLSPVLQRILQRWESVQAVEGDREENDTVASREVIEEQILRNLTRNYCDLLRVLLISNDCSRPRGGQALSGQPGEMDSDMQGEEESGPTAAVSGEQLGPQARRLLAVPELVTYVLLPGLFQCLSVPDSQASRKAAELVGPTLQALGIVNDASNTAPKAPPLLVVEEAMAQEMLLCLLRGLHAHGAHGDQHVSRLLACAVHLYESLRPRFEGVRRVLQEAAGKSEAEMQEFESRLWPVVSPDSKKSSRGPKPLNEKGKRDLFKKLAQSLVGVALSERFRVERVLVANLPSPPRWQSRAKAARAAAAGNGPPDDSEELGLVQLFQADGSS